MREVAFSKLQNVARGGWPDVIPVLALAGAVYARSLDAYFHGDDFVAFVDLVTKPPLDHLYDAVTFSDTNFYWRPLGQLYYRCLYEVFGLDPAAFRVANLVIFLVTLTLVHRLCLRFGFPRPAAAAAVLFIALFPNHVVSVAWVTNAPRLLATAAFVTTLLLLHRAFGAGRGRPAYEAAAWCCMLLACLFDEVAIALAPVPVAYAVLVQREYRAPVLLGVRALAYGGFVAALLPLQLSHTLDDEPRLARYHLSGQVFEQTWALYSQLALPLADSNPMDVVVSTIPDEQWAAGAAAIGLCAAAFVAGSWTMRFLAVWTAAALAPFTLWDMPVVAPRYVYMAAVPFAMLLAAAASSLVSLAARLRLAPAAAGAALAALLAASVYGWDVTRERDQTWEEDIERFRVLATTMKQSYPELPHGTRLIINDGVWWRFWRWPEVTVQVIYRDPSLRVLNIAAGRPYEPTPNDLILYYKDGRLSTTQASR